MYSLVLNCKKNPVRAGFVANTSKHEDLIHYRSTFVLVNAKTITVGIDIGKSLQTPSLNNMHNV